jgi:hypothetical protein
LFTFLSDATLMSHSEYRMVLQSKYIVCDSCKQYILGFLDFMESQGKKVDLTIIANPKVTTSGVFKRLN